MTMVGLEPNLFLRCSSLALIVMMSWIEYFDRIYNLILAVGNWNVKKVYCKVVFGMIMERNHLFHYYLNSIPSNQTNLNKVVVPRFETGGGRYSLVGQQTTGPSRKYRENKINKTFMTKTRAFTSFAQSTSMS